MSEIPEKLDTARLAKALGNRRAGTIGTKRTAMIANLKAHGATSKDPGWRWLAALDDDQVAIVVGSHVETVDSACAMLARGGAPADKDRVTAAAARAREAAEHIFRLVVADGEYMSDGGEDPAIEVFTYEEDPQKAEFGIQDRDGHSYAVRVFAGE